MNKQGKSLVTALLNNSTELLSVATKIDKPQNIDTKPSPELSYVNQLVSRARDKKEVMDDIISLFPDIELAMQILVSSIVSPQTMVTDDFFVRINKVRLPPDVLATITTFIKKRLISEYDYRTLLSEMPKEVLFTYGSYTKVVIPENVLDSIINRNMSTESISRHINDINNNSYGILGHGRKWSTNNFSSEDVTHSRAESNTGEISFGINKNTISLGVSVSDNFNELQLGELLNLQTSMSIEEKVNGKRSNGKFNDDDVDISMFVVDDDEPEPYIELPKQTTLPRASITRPLVMKIPSSAVIPVHAPGDPRKHIGIFVPIGSNGFPLTKIIEPQDLRSKLQVQLKTSTNRLIKTAAKTIYSSDAKTFDESENVIKFYKSVIEKDLLHRLTTGVYKEGVVEIADVDHIYNTLLSRTLANKKTKLLFIPQEYYTYFTAGVYDNGIGKSLLDKLTVISSIRAMLLFARYTAMVRNSVPSTLVKVTLPEDVTDPEKLAEKIVSRVINGFGMRTAIGIMKVSDLSEWVSRLGLEFSFEGHPALEGASIDYERRDSKIDVPDDELEEELRIRTIQAFGLTPEQIDTTLSPEHATSLVINSALFTKRIMEYHKTFNPLLTDYAQKVCKADITIVNGVKQILADNMSQIKKYLGKDVSNLKDTDRVLQTLTSVIIDKLSVTYPQPDNVVFNTLTEQYSDYVSAVDDAMDAVLSSDIVDNEMAGDIADNIDTVRSVFKAYLLRRWMADKNYLPELLEIASTAKSNKGVDLNSVVSEHTKSLMEAALNYAKNVAKSKKKTDSRLERIRSGEDDNEPDNSGGTTENTDEPGDEETPNDEV